MAYYAERFDATWSRFLHLNRTVDSFVQERNSWRRWFVRPVIAFIIPITDSQALAQLVAWQAAMKPWLAYDPPDREGLHITIHMVGSLRGRLGLPMPYSWSREGLDGLTKIAGEAIQSCGSFELQLGPVNAFPNVLFAEVEDKGCLRLMRARLMRALPLRARPIRPWPYLPHVTLGFWGRQPVAPLIEALAPLRAVEPVTLRVTSLEFTIYYPDGAILSPQTPNQGREEVIATYTLAP